MLPHGYPQHATSALIVLARSSIESALGVGPERAPECEEPDCIEWLSSPAATFVTLTQSGRLRGCIGTLEAYQPLIADVRTNAVRAALHDPRFPSLTRAELGWTDIEVSILSAPQPLQVTSRADAEARVRPGVDGVTLHYRRLRSTFLPQVWEKVSEPADFFDQLLRKAGLPTDFWSDDIVVSTYQVAIFHEDDLPDAEAETSGSTPVGDDAPEGPRSG